MTCIIVDCLTYEVRISINWYVDSLINNVFTEVTDKYTPAYIRDVTNNHSNYFLTIKFHLKVVITRGRSLVDGIPHVIVFLNTGKSLYFNHERDYNHSPRLPTHRSGHLQT